MAKKAKPGKGGPHLAAAVFCDDTIQDRDDGTISVIRIIDQIAVLLPPDAPPDFPSKANRITVSGKLFLAFKTGDSTGSHTVRCVMESPSGRKAVVFERTLDFSPQPNGGSNFHIDLRVKVYKGGLFWMYVYVDRKRLALMPIVIKIERGKQPSEASVGGG